MEPRDSYDAFIQQIKLKTGLDLGLYKQDQMLRRLHGSMERSGANSYSDYLKMLDSDKEAKRIFLDRLTINVSELFRNKEHFDTLATRFLPKLGETSKGRVRVWSAGCSYGAEAVSLVILIRETLPSLGVEITASDIDEAILAKAALGEFQEADLRNVSADRLATWFKKDGPVVTAKPELMRHIKFTRHNLLADSAPGQFDLVVCRNVVIYFSDEAKMHVNRLLYNSLRSGGALFIGGTERIAEYEEIGFINPMPFFYVKP